MKRSLKKLTVLLMAVAMVITSMSFTAFADTTTTGSVTVKGVESGTITLYQIVKNENDKWAPTVAGTINVDNLNKTNPEISATEIIDLAKEANKQNGGALASFVVDPAKAANKDGVTWSGLEVGTYLAIVSGAAAEVYNPMIVSVNYDGTNNEISADGTKVGNTAVAKKSEPDLTKKIQDGRDNETAQHGDTTEKGDVITYEVHTTIPSWSDEYTSPKFIFTDKLIQGFESYVAGSLHVYEGANTSGTEITTTGLNSNNFAGDKTEFALDFKVSTGVAARPITIVYKAKISEDAYKQGFDPNKNEATIKYSNNPKDSSDQKEKKDRTYNYTFGIDGELNGLNKGQEGTKDKWTDEVVKVNEDGSTTPISTTTYEGETKWYETPGTTYNGPALNEAEFTLYSDPDCKTVVDKTTTQTLNGAPGKINFNGLEAGTYYLKETKPPEGYASNDTVTKVIISATFNSNGTLKDYTVKMGAKDADEADMVSSKYTATYEKAADGVEDQVKVVERDGNSKTYFIKNDKLGSLPATGGMGTIIFTIAGIAIMAIAAGLFIANRKNASK